MKKVYIPTEEEYRQIQSLTKNNSLAYKYLVAKVIEALVMETILDEAKPMLQTPYEYFRDIPEISYRIARMYPDEIERSKEAQNDVMLCLELLNGGIIKNGSITYLDDVLPYFEDSKDILSRGRVIASTVKSLYNGLQEYPKYRFEYTSNSLLDNIFACEIPLDKISEKSDYMLPAIEPAYALRIPKTLDFDRDLIRYTDRYGVSSLNYASIYENNEEKTKRLLRCLDYHKRNYQ